MEDAIFERLKKKVVKWGDSKVIRMSEAKIGDEFYLLSKKEFDFLLERGKE